jgi:hypothetical protein
MYLHPHLNFCSTRIYTRGFTLAGQMLYHLSHTSSGSAYFGDRVTCLLRSSLDRDLPSLSFPPSLG